MKMSIIIQKVCLLIALTSLFITPLAALPGKSKALALGFMNDNYTGSTENGVEGRYIGADDFITTNLYALSRFNEYDFDLRYMILTSRVYEWRYDLIHLGASRHFEIGPLATTFEAGILAKGNYGGDQVQNNFHKMRDIKGLDLPYLGKEIAPEFGVRLGYEKNIHRLRGLSLNANLYFDAPLAIKPISLTPELGAQIERKWFVIELMAGWRQYVNEVEHYSEMTQSGFCGGIRMSLKLNGVSSSGGIGFISTRNLGNDPQYKDKDFSHNSQITFSGGINAEVFKFRDLIYF